jgi:hypothetical protein
MDLELTVHAQDRAWLPVEKLGRMPGVTSLAVSTGIFLSPHH